MFLFMGSQVYKGTTQLSSPESTTKETADFLDYAGVHREDIAKDFTIEEFTVTASHDDHTIPAIHIHNGDKDRDTAILIHGLGGTKDATLPVAKMFLNLGYNVIAYDQMNSGGNTALVNTFGARESDDTMKVLTQLDTELSDDCEIVMWGTSFGGATAAMAAAKDEGIVDKLVLDSPMADALDMIRIELDKVAGETPFSTNFMLAAGEPFLRVHQGVSYYELDAAEAIKDSDMPVLLIHSRDDEVTPPHMGHEYEEALGDRVTAIWTEGKHSEAYITQPEQYQQWLADFLGQ
ncbi:alpha/beta hydrolase [Corynebacterium breve]|uniref:Alpha/beta hydrolase n=1 Tax=Corynebacterium breve TaxID=3049799 RepID=A0ABY8VGE8_9CORY|nr:alpha/beta hydrolase [Corynebacterium breve]WIM68715.1 alpha/beta hydrolase [Corynebacterium breve]